MKATVNLTEGPIKKQLYRLTIPIIATNFIQTTYQLVDMIWLGKIGGDAVTAVGTASFYLNLSMALLTLASIGTGVKIAQSLGSGNKRAANEYYKNGFFIATFIAIIYFLFVLTTSKTLIGLFNLNDISIEKAAQSYLLLSMTGILFSFYNGLFAIALTSQGNSKLAFRISTIGFFINLILDPVLIFGLGPIPYFGTNGAAAATIIANCTVTIIFFLKTNVHRQLFEHFTFDYRKILVVLKMGLPITIQRVIFTLISIIMAVIVAKFGSTGIAVQRIGVQIEAISFMTIGGLQGAIAAFIGQNYGAGKFTRLTNGYRQALIITTIFGLLISVVFISFPEQLFRIFINDEKIITEGIHYMRIIGFSQVFMCIELLTVGAFNGIGKTYVPPLFSITLTAIRIPLALILSKPSMYGLNGVWLSISITSILKGIVLVGWFKFTMRRTIKGVQHDNN